jgi:hypothetical protein
MASSPFRSTQLSSRESAANRLIMQRERELLLLEKRWAGERTAKRQRLLMTRIMATRNNLRSWQDYLRQGCPRVANATTLV